MLKKVFVYGFDKMMRVRDVKWIREDEATNERLREIAQRMLDEGPYILSEIYAVVNRPGLREEFMESVHGGMEAHLEFQDMVSREGLCLAM